MTASEVAVRYSYSLLSRRYRPSQAKVRSTTHRRGATANGDTIGGVAPGGSQRRCRPPSLRDTTWKAMPRRWWAQSRNGPGEPPAVQPPQQCHGAVAVAHVGGGHLDLADQAEGVDQQVALAAVEPLGA